MQEVELMSEVAWAIFRVFHEPRTNYVLVTPSGGYRVEDDFSGKYVTPSNGLTGRFLKFHPPPTRLPAPNLAMKL